MVQHCWVIPGPKHFPDLQLKWGDVMMWSLRAPPLSRELLTVRPTALWCDVVRVAPPSSVSLSRSVSRVILLCLARGPTVISVSWVYYCLRCCDVNLDLPLDTPLLCLALSRELTGPTVISVSRVYYCLRCCDVNLDLPLDTPLLCLALSRELIEPTVISVSRVISAYGAVMWCGALRAPSSNSRVTSNSRLRRELQHFFTFRN
jgi:hypothetical protein